MTTSPHTFDQLYVVSDMHMGGRRNGEENSQIFNQGTRLGHFIRYIGDQVPEGRVALVLNGDVFDSLAEDLAGYVALDAASALRMMEHLYTDASFAPVWDALASFVATPRRYLVFVVGNHDLEMALPVVEDSIRQRLAGGNSDGLARILFSTHGAGYGCLVGSKRVFCSHGNELDSWNWVDYSALGQLANAINAGRRVDAQKWKPNAGTRLVIDVMNEVKRRLPFVDLLKPEAAAVAGVLMTLDRDLLSRIDLTSAWPVWRGERQGARVTSDILGAYAVEMHTDGTPVQRTAADVAYGVVGPNLRELLEDSRAGTTEDELLIDIERTRLLPSADVSYDGVETLGVRDLVAGAIGLVSKAEGLRRALLDWLTADRTFDIHDPDDALYLGMASRVGDSIDFVVTGHTHKPRAMTYPSGCHYYNAGTWIRSLRLTREVLANSDSFEKRLWPVLSAGRMSAIDAATIPGPGGQDVSLVLDRTNAVRIVADGPRVSGDLLRISDKESGGIVVSLEEGTTTFQAR